MLPVTVRTLISTQLHVIPSWSSFTIGVATGQWREGMEHGHGQCMTADGASYDGQWMQGTRCITLHLPSCMQWRSTQLPLHSTALHEVLHLPYTAAYGNAMLLREVGRALHAVQRCAWHCSGVHGIALLCLPCKRGLGICNPWRHDNTEGCKIW